VSIFQQVTGIADAGVTDWALSHPWAPVLTLAVLAGATLGACLTIGGSDV
jgi:hypothetical protein